MCYKTAMSDKITCPKCKYEIEVAEALSTQLKEQLRKEFDADLRQKEDEFATKTAELRKREELVEASKKAIDSEVQGRLAKERARLDQEAMAKAKETVALELRDKEAELTDAKAKLQQAQQAELDLRKRARELEDQKRELDLTVARKLDEERENIRATAKKEAADERALKEAEKDKLIGDLRLQIDDLKRKSEQGSQQTQGEVMELEDVQLPLRRRVSPPRRGNRRGIRHASRGPGGGETRHAKAVGQAREATRTRCHQHRRTVRRSLGGAVGGGRRSTADACFLLRNFGRRPLWGVAPYVRRSAARTIPAGLLRYASLQLAAVSQGRSVLFGGTPT